MATGDVKENEFGKVNSIEDGSYIRTMDAQGNSVQIDKASFIEAVRAAMPVATTDKNGLVSTSLRNSLIYRTIIIQPGEAFNTGISSSGLMLIQHATAQYEIELALFYENLGGVVLSNNSDSVSFFDENKKKIHVYREKNEGPILIKNNSGEVRTVYFRMFMFIER